MTVGAAPADALEYARRSLALLGHPDHRWSIVLHARLRHAPNADDVELRLGPAFGQHPSLGPVPRVTAVAPGEFADALWSAASDPYLPSEPAVRLALIGAPEPGVLLAAHHGVLDGLGLLALLGLVLGETVSSSARGVSVAADGGDRQFGAFAVRRVTEALLRPPTRIAAPAVAATAQGESLAELAIPAIAGGTAALIAATVRAASGWNVEHGQRARRIVVAIGASQRSGSEPTLEHRAAWMRIHVSSGDDHAVRTALETAPPLPAGPGSDRFARAGRLGASLLSRRLGSTLLVSNIGAVSGGPALERISFYPVTHGHRAVALGAATLRRRTMLTLRGEHRDFDPATLERFLERVAAQLGASGMYDPGARL